MKDDCPKNYIYRTNGPTRSFGVFLFRPKPHYFVLTCVSTVVVWSAGFAVKRFRTAIVAALAFQLALHQVAFRLWQAELSAFWRPFAQFAALQYIIFVPLLARDPLPPNGFES